MITLTNETRHCVVEINHEIYPDGSIRVDTSALPLPPGDDYVVVADVDDYTLEVVVADVNDLIAVSMLVDAINTSTSRISSCVIYTTLGTRDDKREYTHGPLGFKAYSSIINSWNIPSVGICQPHSPVTIALVNNSYPIYMDLSWVPHDTIIVCPDLGASKFVTKVAKGREIVFCDKVRDPKTGKLSGFKVLSDISNYPNDQKYLLVDDICDGGGTMIGIAQELMDKSPNMLQENLDLYVVYGIFSRGTDELKKHFSNINCDIKY